MSATKKGWDIPSNFLEIQNRSAFLCDFPHEGRLEGIEGVRFQRSENHPDALVSLNVRDHKSESQTLWMDVPNAMYLLAMLEDLRRRLGAPAQMTPPPPTKPHPIQ